MTYGPETRLSQLRPGAVFEDENGDRHVLRHGPNNGGWLPVLRLSDGRDSHMPQEFVVREIVFDLPVDSPPTEGS